jgi:hypothetical protein
VSVYELCELLSALLQAAFHQLPTVSWLLLQALFTESSCRELPLSPSPGQWLVNHLLLSQSLFTEISCGELALSPSPVQRLVSHVLLQVLLIEGSCRVQLLAPTPSPVHSEHPALPAVCPFQFLVYYSGVFFAGQGSVCPGCYAGLSQGWLWEYRVPLICSPVCLHLPSRLGAGVWW